MQVRSRKKENNNHPKIPRQLKVAYTQAEVYLGSKHKTTQTQPTNNTGHSDHPRSDLAQVNNRLQGWKASSGTPPGGGWGRHSGYLAAKENGFQVLLHFQHQRLRNTMEARVD